MNDDMSGRKFSRPWSSGRIVLRLGDAFSEMRWLLLTAAWTALAALLFAHYPRSIVAAEFWGEDGPVWYAQAYNLGFASLLIPEGGYLNTLQRLLALLAQPFELAKAPTIMAAMALALQVTPAVYLLSKRLDKEWPSLSGRLAFAVLFVIMPNATETSVTVTNSQWYLALLALLIVAGDVPRGKIGCAVDVLVLLVSGLSGPFCIILLPIAAHRACRCPTEERSQRIGRLVLLAVTATIQCLFILQGGRSVGPLGATPHLLFTIIAMVPLQATVGQEGFMGLVRHGLLNNFWFPFACTLVTLGLIAAALAHRQRLHYEATFFVAVFLALALFRPLMSLTHPQWPLFLSGGGSRYFLYPMLAWWGALFVLVSHGGRITRSVSLMLLIGTLGIAVPLDWGDRNDYARTDFVERAKRFDASEVGTRMVFEIHPPGWYMELTKKGSKTE